MKPRDTLVVEGPVSFLEKCHRDEVERGQLVKRDITVPSKRISPFRHCRRETNFGRQWDFRSSTDFFETN